MSAAEASPVPQDAAERALHVALTGILDSDLASAVVQKWKSAYGDDPFCLVAFDMTDEAAQKLASVLVGDQNVRRWAETGKLWPFVLVSAASGLLMLQTYGSGVQLAEVQKDTALLSSNMAIVISAGQFTVKELSVMFMSSPGGTA